MGNENCTKAGKKYPYVLMKVLNKLNFHHVSAYIGPYVLILSGCTG